MLRFQEKALRIKTLAARLRDALDISDTASIQITIYLKRVIREVAEELEKL